MADFIDDIKENHKNYLNVVAFLINVVVTYCMGVFGPQNDQEILFQYQTLVTPAEWTFVTWLVITISQGVLTAMQFRREHRGKEILVEAIGYYFIGLCLGQAAWVLAVIFGYFTFSFIAMLATLLCLIMIFKAQYNIPLAGEGKWEYWYFRFPIELHLGWLISMSFVNFNVMLEDLDASSTWLLAGAGISLVGTLICAAGSLWYLSKPKFVIAMALAWAMLGVSIELRNPKQSIFAGYLDSQISAVQISAAFIATIIFTALIVRLIKGVIKERYQERVLELTKSQEEAQTEAAASADYVLA
mmetsp:Transcript_64425/g.95371  ORF Transcript_64425/g.95371 Transcript_64425/m.95371 type:complete len:301 (-) Transcript_64425:224-1126(-)